MSQILFSHAQPVSYFLYESSSCTSMSRRRRREHFPEALPTDFSPKLMMRIGSYALSQNSHWQKERNELYSAEPKDRMTFLEHKVSWREAKTLHPGIVQPQSSLKREWI